MNLSLLDVFVKMVNKCETKYYFDIQGVKYINIYGLITVGTAECNKFQKKV